ncbi:hypothetical protein EK904_008970, partial [Melospiza melodia maxima]
MTENALLPQSFPRLPFENGPLAVFAQLWYFYMRKKVQLHFQPKRNEDGTDKASCGDKAFSWDCVVVQFFANCICTPDCNLCSGESLTQLKQHQDQSVCSEQLSEQCEGRVGPAVPGAEPQQSPGRAQSTLSIGRARLEGGTGNNKRQQPGCGAAASLGRKRLKTWSCALSKNKGVKGRVELIAELLGGTRPACFLLSYIGQAFHNEALEFLQEMELGMCLRISLCRSRVSQVSLLLLPFPPQAQQVQFFRWPDNTQLCFPGLGERWEELRELPGAHSWSD